MINNIEIQKREIDQNEEHHKFYLKTQIKKNHYRDAINPL